MSAAELNAELRGIICVIKAVVRYAQANDRSKLPIRCELRSALEQLERRPERRRLHAPGGLP
jgi:hypothetical protein